MTFAFRLRRFGWRIRLRWARLVGRTTTVEMSAMAPFYERIWRDAAATLGASFAEVRPGLWRVSLGRATTLIDNFVVQLDDPVVLNLAGDKAYCHRLFVDGGLAVPEYRTFTLTTFDVAAQFMAEHPDWYFVVKPVSGTSGARGVTTHIRTLRECRAASALASLYGSSLLIERWIAGESYRLLFLDGELIHASRRRGRWVTGDGASTVNELLKTDGQAAAEDGREIAVRDRAATLAAQQVGPASVPARGRRILVQSAASAVQRNAEIRTVFDEDATAQIGPALRDEARRAIDALGSRFAGVDIITLDPARALAASGGVINEINTTPGLHHHYGLANRAADAGPAADVLLGVLRQRSQAAVPAPNAMRFPTHVPITKGE